AMAHAGQAGHATAQQEDAPMVASGRGSGAERAFPQWSASNKLARLDGRFSLGADGRTLHVAYKVSSIGRYALLVFDRGDALSVATNRQAPGSVGVPQVQFQEGDLVLRHVALPLREPTPTVPPSPLASRVLPGSEYDNHFAYVLPEAGSGQVRRVRYCQGAVGVPRPLPDSAQRSDGAWSVPNAAAAHQGVLCS